ncbi:hypothetical protein FOZ60_013040 [Perkinsus olseni]|uniref:Uncharacterized protein n=1 Tax=Perkinsus olseni TaxID=32597 RepID=A0A7J6P9X8_PEROL|nr:hypothetical protein FOZ60_013040 [Perkinsus olseni]
MSSLFALFTSEAVKDGYATAIVNAAESLKIAEVPIFSILKDEHPAYKALVAGSATTVFDNQTVDPKLPLDTIKLRVEAYIKLAIHLADKATTETGKSLSTTAFIAQFATLFGRSPSELLQAPHTLIRTMVDDPLAYRELLVDLPTSAVSDQLGAVRRMAREQNIPISQALDQILSNPVDIRAWAVALRDNNPTRQGLGFRSPTAPYSRSGESSQSVPPLPADMCKFTATTCPFLALGKCRFPKHQARQSSEAQPSTKPKKE